ncbi:MAG: hypothetical protein ABIT20_18425 [Gemmatimonadaceae bacterium]
MTIVPIWRDASGAQVGAGCDEHHCITSLQVELYDDIGGHAPAASANSAARVPLSQERMP